MQRIISAFHGGLYSLYLMLQNGCIWARSPTKVTVIPVSMIPDRRLSSNTLLLTSVIASLIFGTDLVMQPKASLQLGNPLAYPKERQ
jgi:hypothetical protein